MAAGGTPGQVLVTASEDETSEAGRAMAATLRPGAVVMLIGPLGAGKTVFVRGLAAGLGLDAREVHSPSYTLVNEYGPSASGRVLVHADLYRIDSPAEIEELGLGDYLTRGCVIAVEWGEKLPGRLQAGAARVSIEYLEDVAGEHTAEQRKIMFKLS